MYFSKFSRWRIMGESCWTWWVVKEAGASCFGLEAKFWDQDNSRCCSNDFYTAGVFQYRAVISCLQTVGAFANFRDLFLCCAPPSNNCFIPETILCKHFCLLFFPAVLNRVFEILFSSFFFKNTGFVVILKTRCLSVWKSKLRRQRNHEKPCYLETLNWHFSES